jgi:hypothetical protein
MPTVYLYSGEVHQVPIEELEDFIYANKDKIKPIIVQRRGKRRFDVPSNDATANVSGK